MKALDLNRSKRQSYSPTEILKVSEKIITLNNQLQGGKLKSFIFRGRRDFISCCFVPEAKQACCHELRKLPQKQVLSQEINDSRDLEINRLCSRMCVADDFFYGIPVREAQHIKFACFYGNQVQTL